MANYTSHAIMSELLLNRLKKKKKVFVDVDKDVMKLFSLGQDLTYLNSSCFKDTHIINSKKFFKETIKYIYDNNLQYDKNVMSYLYGHIAHYSLDISIHPFIKEIVSNVDSKSMFSPHNILECDMDRYLMYKYNRNRKYDLSFLNTKVMKDENISSIISNTYRNTYEYINVNLIYKKTIIFIKYFSKLLQYVYFHNMKLFNILVKKNKYEYGSNFYNYMNNGNKDIYDEMLDNSIKKAEKIIYSVNKYLYVKDKEKYLDLVFDDTPYDIGLINDINYEFITIPIYSSIEIK